jgi:hypothetical protein
VPRVKRVAVLGALGATALFGMTGCTAEAAGSPTGTPSPTVSRTGVGRADIEVQLQPASVKAGGKVWVLANCPIPQGGPQHRGVASSDVFSTPVTLDPIPATPTAAPSGTVTPAPRPWVRGQAVVSEDAEVGTHVINARCETNDTGTATLRILAATTPTARPTTTRTPISTRGPGTGGGGTAAGGPGDSGVPLGLTGALLAAALAGGVGLAVVRRRRP